MVTTERRSAVRLVAPPRWLILVTGWYCVLDISWTYGIIWHNGWTYGIMWVNDGLIMGWLWVNYGWRWVNCSLSMVDIGWCWQWLNDGESWLLHGRALGVPWVAPSPPWLRLVSGCSITTCHAWGIPRREHPQGRAPLRDSAGPAGTEPQLEGW